MPAPRLRNMLLSVSSFNFDSLISFWSFEKEASLWTPNTWFSTFRETKNLTLLQSQSLWEALHGSNLCDLWQSWPRLASCHSTFGREMSRVRCCVLSDRLSSRRQPARENCQTSHLLFHRNDTLTIYHISSDTLYPYNYSFSRIIIIIQDDFHHY